MPVPPQATSHESYHEAADRERLRPLLRACQSALRVSFPKLRALPTLPLYGENSMSHEILKALASRRWFLGVAGSGLARIFHEGPTGCVCDADVVVNPAT